jgi:hypothetical protein
LVPASLGEWLTTDRVCKDCNDYFGHAVDRVAESQFLAGLRREAGLQTRRPAEGEFFDPHVGGSRTGRINDDGTVAAVSPVFEYEDGRGGVIQADTQEEAFRIAEKFRRRAKREGRTMSFRELDPQPPAIVRMRIRHDLPEAREIIDLIHREAAKIATEYIALAAGPEIALLPELDPIRALARVGSGPDAVSTKYLGPNEVWLPRSRRLLLLGPMDERPSQEQLDSIAGALVPADGSAPDSDKVPHWTSFRHQLGLHRRRVAWFQLTLFDWFVALVPLPDFLPIPWGSMDVRDCLTGEVAATRPSA